MPPPRFYCTARNRDIGISRHVVMLDKLSKSPRQLACMKLYFGFYFLKIAVGRYVGSTLILKNFVTEIAVHVTSVWAISGQPTIAYPLFLVWVRHWYIIPRLAKHRDIFFSISVKRSSLFYNPYCRKERWSWFADQWSSLIAWSKACRNRWERIIADLMPK